MSTGPENSGQKLDGWKAIAGHLKVGVRSAQDYERQRGLPIHRHVDQDKPRVYAYTAELDSWLVRREAPLSSSPGSASLVVESPANTPPIAGSPGIGAGQVEVVDRRQWLTHWGLAGGLAVVGLAGLSTVLVSRRRAKSQQPLGYRISGATLMVLGPDGEELCRHTFPDGLEERFYKERQSPVVQPLVDNRRSDVAFIFLYSPTDRSTRPATLVCLNSKGEPQWEFVPGRTVSDRVGRQFAPPYWVNKFATFCYPGSTDPYVVVLSHHNWSFASQVAVLDGRSGRLIREYWHRGQLLHLAVADLQGDGQLKVLVAGVNDAPEYKQATVVVLDLSRLAGSSKDPAGVPYFQGMSAAHEQRIIFFPRTAINREQEFNRVVALRVLPDRIMAVVAEGIVADAPYVVYEVDYQLRPIQAALSSELKQRYNALQETGKLPKESPEVIAANLLRGVVVIGG